MSNTIQFGNNEHIIINGIHYYQPNKSGWIYIIDTLKKHTCYNMQRCTSFEGTAEELFEITHAEEIEYFNDMKHLHKNGEVPFNLRIINNAHTYAIFNNDYNLYWNTMMDQFLGYKDFIMSEYERSDYNACAAAGIIIFNAAYEKGLKEASGFSMPSVEAHLKFKDRLMKEKVLRMREARLAKERMQNRRRILEEERKDNYCKFIINCKSWISKSSKKIHKV